MKTYRVAILGCRARGTAAARAYYQHPRTEIVGLCDLVAERRDKLGDELGIAPRYDDLDRMMGETRPDIVAIPTGTEWHYDLARRVLEYGAHIDVEKPLCTSLEQADDLVKQARQRGAKIAVHHQGRTGAAMQTVLRTLASGRIGDLVYILASGKGYYGGYGLMNIGTHLLNGIIGITGHCHGVSASALTGGRAIAPKDVIFAPGGMGYSAGERITATLEFGHNVTATLLQHRLPRVDSTAYRIELHGTEGRLVWKTGAVWWLPVPHFVPGADEGRWQPIEPLLPATYDASGPASEPDFGFVDEYVSALDEDREHSCSGYEGLHVMELLMGILESAAYGRRVKLPQVDRSHPLLRWCAEAGQAPPTAGPRDYGEWLGEEDRRLGRS